MAAMLSAEILLSACQGLFSVPHLANQAQQSVLELLS